MLNVYQMHRDYDIFERFPDGTSVWRGCVSGQYETERKLHELAEHSENEFFVMDIRSGEVVPFALGRGGSQG